MHVFSIEPLSVPVFPCSSRRRSGPAARGLVAGALLAAAAVTVGSAPARAQEKTTKDSSRPLTYSIENTGAQYPAPSFPSYAELPIVRPLPDPFLFTSGLRDTSFNAWEVRRNEIRAAIEKYELGPKPDCSDCTITASYVPPAAGSTSTNGVLTVNVTRKGKTLTLTSGVYIPSGQGSGPFPVLIPMELGGFNFGGTTYTFPPPTPPDYGSLPSAPFQGQPIATVGYVLTQVAGYAFSSPSDHTQDPFYTLYPELCSGICTSNGQTVPSNSGEYAAWAWGVSRLIDGMEIASHQSTNPLPIDMTHIAVTGCSYAGKMALISGAFDERVALTIAQENGGGGAASWRASHQIEVQGSVEDVDDTNYDWFAGQMKQFSGPNVYKLPIDHHELMAMVAPRALLQTGNTDFTYLSNRSNYISSRATQKVYNQFGIGDRFGFYIDGGHAHCGTLPAETPVIASFVNKFMLGQSTASTDVEVSPASFTFDYNRWSAWWGKQSPYDDPSFPTNWTVGGNAVVALYNGLGFAPVTQGGAVSAAFQLRMPGAHPSADVSLTGSNVEVDVLCPDRSTYTMSVPFPATQVYHIGANVTGWQPPAGTYQGVLPAPACPSGVTSGTIVNAYFSALGLTSGVGNPAKQGGFASTDTTDALDLRFGCSSNGVSTGYSSPVNVKPTAPAAQ